MVREQQKKLRPQNRRGVSSPGTAASAWQLLGSTQIVSDTDEAEMFLLSRLQNHILLHSSAVARDRGPFCYYKQRGDSCGNLQEEEGGTPQLQRSPPATHIRLERPPSSCNAKQHLRILEMI
ncbi:hypothetical protein EYF80_034537 [Liparis tanakae]|uniref:Uncharacterized protein n=1 Tax=Liparis tanakae TaxID=230148 RepID=A0A4Z2GPQ8_9TELE|nr:hypothetical protein EYF80_034537 [Liparis tanakae]